MTFTKEKTLNVWFLSTFIINNSLKRDAKGTILTFTGSKYHTIKLIKLMSLFLNPQKRNSPTLTLENEHSAQHAEGHHKIVELGGSRRFSKPEDRHILLH